LAILQLAEEACLSAATTSRWLDALKQHGLIAHCPDPRAGGRDFIELSARGAAGMQQWVQDCIERQADARSDDRVIDLLTRMQGDRR
jgi:DNA-binding MarR family transcriptional regulator